MIHYSFFESILGKSKKKRKSTREPQLSENSRADRKRAKQDVVHRMVMKYLESETKVDVYGNLKTIISGGITVSPWMTEDRLKCAARRHKHKISNNQLLDKEEAETDKSKHRTSVLGLISNTPINGGRQKVSTLKNKKNLQDIMDKANLHLTCLFYSASNLEHRSANGPLISSLILSSEFYFYLTSTSNPMASFRYYRSYNLPKHNFYLS